MVSLIEDYGFSDENITSYNALIPIVYFIYKNRDFLEEAILQQKKVLFRYFDLNEHGEKVYRREGHRYVVEPIGLVFHEDNYYLMIYSARHGNTANCVTACFLDLCRAIWMSANAFKQLNYRLREVTSWKNNL
jgi:hypothetical protein